MICINIQVDDKLLEFLRCYDVFQFRSGMQSKGPAPKYINRLVNGDVLSFKDDVKIEKYTTFSAGNVLFTAGAFLSSASPLSVGSKVGRYVSIGSGLKSIGYRHPVEAVGMNSTFFNFNRENVKRYFDVYESEFGEVKKNPVPTPQPQNRPVEIGNDVWIGSNVTINGGVKIGDGSIIASSSVVTKNVEPYSIVAGIPARHRKWRFPKELVQELMSVKWWNYELGDMYREKLDFSSPSSFLSGFSKVKGSIRKAAYKKLPIYSYSLFEKDIGVDKNIIIDHKKKVLCFDPSSMRIVHKSIDFLFDSFPIEIRKIPEGVFLYVDSIGFLDLDKSLKVRVRDFTEIFSYKIHTVDSDMRICIEVVNEGYLCSVGYGNFLLQPHVKNWEIYNLPNGIE